MRTLSMRKLEVFGCFQEAQKEIGGLNGLNIPQDKFKIITFLQENKTETNYPHVKELFIHYNTCFLTKICRLCQHQCAIT